MSCSSRASLGEQKGNLLDTIVCLWSGTCIALLPPHFHHPCSSSSAPLPENKFVPTVGAIIFLLTASHWRHLWRYGKSATSRHICQQMTNDSEVSRSRSYATHFSIFPASTGHHAGPSGAQWHTGAHESFCQPPFQVANFPSSFVMCHLFRPKLNYTMTCRLPSFAVPYL